MAPTGAIVDHAAFDAMIPQHLNNAGTIGSGDAPPPFRTGKFVLVFPGDILRCIGPRQVSFVRHWEKLNRCAAGTTVIRITGARTEQCELTFANNASSHRIPCSTV